MNDGPVTDYDVQSGVFPAELLAQERWFVWKLTDDDRKIPRAPWHNPDWIDKYEGWDNQEMWADFETADEWVQKMPEMHHASCIPHYESSDEERLIFFDFDDCRNPDTGAIHPTAWAFIQGQNLHAAVSSSGTGLHGFGWGSLPEGYKPSFEHELPGWEYHDEPHMEVYAASRFIGLTGDHIECTPVSVPDLGDDGRELFHRFGSERVTGTEREPSVTKKELEDKEKTTDVEDIYDAISHTTPADIRIRSTETKQRADGTVSLDPSWEHSESGTRLAQFDDHWLYRKGNHRLDALQLVALEERIITDAGEYPSGEDFVEAVEELRKRGAHIPELHEPRPNKTDVDAVTEAQATAEENESSEQTPPAAGGERVETSATDGGVDAATTTTSQYGPDIDSSVDERVRDRLRSEVLSPLDPPEDSDVESIDRDVAIDRTSRILNGELAFVRPRDDTRGWRDTLYNYVPEEGIYEPHGRAEIERRIERILGAVVSNQFINEVVGKVERLSRVRAKELSESPERIVVENGILDLTTGELSPHTPAEYHKQRIDIEYDPDAECPAVDEFLHDIVEEQDVPKLYRFISHSLYRDYPGNKAAMLLGEGQNGKSEFLNLFQEFLGRYNVSNQSLSQLNENKWSPARLNGKLANIVSDMSDQSPDSMQMFKQLTGNDPIEADVKFENPIQFTNHATLLFACNEMPVLHDDTRGNWRRWQLIQFPNTFDNDDPNAKDKVPKEELRDRLYTEEEFKGLLAKCVEEIQRYDETNQFFPDADGWETSRSKMRRAAEPVFDFATVCLRPDPEGELEKGLVRAAYNEYATQEGLSKLSREDFGRRLLGLSDYNIDTKRPRDDGQRVQVYEGISFTDRGRSLVGLGEDTDDSQSQLDGGRDGPPDDAVGPKADAQRIYKMMRDEGVKEFDRGKLLAVAGERLDMEPNRAEAALEKGRKELGIFQMPEEHRIQRV